VAVDRSRGHGCGGEGRSIHHRVACRPAPRAKPSASLSSGHWLIGGVLTISGHGRQQQRQQHWPIAAVYGQLLRRWRPGRRRLRTALNCEMEFEDRGPVGTARRWQPHRNEHQASAWLIVGQLVAGEGRVADRRPGGEPVGAGSGRTPADALQGSMRAGIVTVVRKRPWLSLGIGPKPTVPPCPLWNTRSVLIEVDPGLLQPLPWTVTLVPTGPLLGETTRPAASSSTGGVAWVGWARSMTIRVGLVSSRTRKPTRWATPMPAVVGLRRSRGADLAQGREVGAEPGRGQDWPVVLVVGGGPDHDL
jgi:hypothetical protein